MPTSSPESRTLCRAVLFDTGFLLLTILLVLFIDLQLQIRKGRPDVILAHVTEVLDAPASTPMERTLALNDLHWNLDRFHDGDLADTLSMLRRELGTQPEPTKIEVAIILIQCHDLSGLPLIEESLMHPSAEKQGTGMFSAEHSLQMIRDLGVGLSIDDFGVGYAMMQQLKNIPATELKIDRAFVRDMQDNDRDRIMVQKTIEMGHELGMRVIAEGVETKEQLELLRLAGCDSAQGYYFSRALPATELVGWLKTYRAGLKRGSKLHLVRGFQQSA